MNDMIINAAQDPSCILAVTPDRGGSWWATLRPDTPRNFAENAHAFYDCQAVVQEALDPTHDYSFLIEAEIVRENPECSVFYAGGDKFPFGVYNYSDNTIRVFSNLLRSATDTSSKYATVIAYSGDTRLQGRHTIESRVEGDAMRVFLDGNEIEHSYTFARAGSAAVGLPQCNSGYVYKIQIEDLTTGETVWQASHDDLFETNNPWPSATLRNFAEEPSTWYDAVVAGYAAIGDHDCEFEISYTNNVDYPGQIFYSNSQNGSINLNFISGNQNSFSSFRAFNTQSASVVIPIDAGVQNSGSHTVKFKRQNGTAEAWVDGQLVKSVTSDLGNKTLYANVMPLSQFDGNIFYIRLTDLTTGKTVWSYPSEAERVRLLTKTNVRTDRGVFEAADETKTARIDTALDLRGKISDYTVFVEFEAANMDEDVSAQQLCGQGSATNMSLTEIAACMYYYQNSKYYIRHAWELGGKSVLFYTEVEKLTGRHQLASILQINETGAGSRAMMYLDGKLIHTADNDNSPSGVGSAEHFTIIEPANTTQTYSRKYGKIYSCLVFDRALTAAEIVAFGVRRPRNFAEKPMTWNSFNAIQSTVDFSHDFTFEIEFECTVQTNARIFYISSTGSLFGVYQFSSGDVIFTTSLLGNTVTGRMYTEFTLDPAVTAIGRHVAKMVVAGNTATAYLDDVVIGSANAEYIQRVTPSNLSTPTSAIGYIYSMRLTDDTTGETVWRANHNDLFAY